MARKYSKSASKDVERAMDKRKKGTLKIAAGVGHELETLIVLGVASVRNKQGRRRKYAAAGGAGGGGGGGGG